MPPDLSCNIMALILAIDDSLTTLQLLELQLKKLGHVTLLADTGEEGLELARTANPDIILLDLVMPGMDGFDVLEQLKNSDSTRDIPAIIISAETDKKNILRVMKYEIKDILSKKFSVKTFKEKIDSAIDFGARQRETRNKKNQSPYTIISQLGRTTISFRSGLKESLAEAKKQFDATFFKDMKNSVIILDIRYISAFSFLDVSMIEEMLKLVPGDPLYLIAGKHYGTIMLNMDLEKRVHCFISWNDMEMHSYNSTM